MAEQNKLKPFQEMLNKRFIVYQAVERGISYKDVTKAYNARFQTSLSVPSIQEMYRSFRQKLASKRSQEIPCCLNCRTSLSVRLAGKDTRKRTGETITKYRCGVCGYTTSSNQVRLPFAISIKVVNPRVLLAAIKRIKAYPGAKIGSPEDQILLIVSLPEQYYGGNISLFGKHGGERLEPVSVEGRKAKVYASARKIVKFYEKQQREAEKVVQLQP